MGRRRCDVGVAVVSTYPPRECGIGTFTRDLTRDLASLPQPVGISIAAINAAGERYDYDAVVRLELDTVPPPRRSGGGTGHAQGSDGAGGAPDGCVMRR